MSLPRSPSRDRLNLPAAHHGSTARADSLPVGLLDIGSTAIKGLRLDRGGGMRGLVLARDKAKPLDQQAMDALVRLGSPANVLICSSANGGLRVGLICLSLRFSAAILERTLVAAGANVIYTLDWHAAGQPQSVRAHVDVLIIAGGIDTYPETAVTRGLTDLAASQAALAPFPHDRLIYAGHRRAADAARAIWSKLVVLPNPLRDGFAVRDGSLADQIRALYLDDLESKRDLLPLRDVSSVPILPTPHIVSNAFGRLSRRFAGPALLLDVGGATTDVHFPLEAMSSESLVGGSAAFPEIGRFVHVALGVADSRAATLSTLLADRRCADVLTALHDEGFRAVYSELQEGRADARTVFGACVYLALRWACAPPTAGPRLDLGRIATLALTGGASQVLAAQDVARLFRLALDEGGAGPSPLVLLDSDYRWWSLGLLPASLIDTAVLEALHV